MPRTQDSSDNRGQVLQFVRPGAAGTRGGPQGQPRPVDDLGRFEHLDPETVHDYRHRQVTNLAAFAVCVLLVICGVWLATMMAALRRDQDCALAGHRNCAQISITGQTR